MRFNHMVKVVRNLALSIFIYVQRNLILVTHEKKKEKSHWINNLKNLQGCLCKSNDWEIFVSVSYCQPDKAARQRAKSHQ